jgi:hypothetical protein
VIIFYSELSALLRRPPTPTSPTIIPKALRPILLFRVAHFPILEQTLVTDRISLYSFPELPASRLGDRTLANMVAHPTVPREARPRVALVLWRRVRSRLWLNKPSRRCCISSAGGRRELGSIWAKAPALSSGFMSHDATNRFSGETLPPSLVMMGQVLGSRNDSSFFMTYKRTRHQNEWHRLNKFPCAGLEVLKSESRVKLTIYNSANETPRTAHSDFGTGTGRVACDQSQSLQQ